MFIVADLVSLNNILFHLCIDKYLTIYSQNFNIPIAITHIMHPILIGFAADCVLTFQINEFQLRIQMLVHVRIKRG